MQNPLKKTLCYTMLFAFPAPQTTPLAVNQNPTGEPRMTLGEKYRMSMFTHFMNQFIANGFVKRAGVYELTLTIKPFVNQMKSNIKYLGM